MNKLIIDTLKPLNVPVSLLKYSGKSNTYITFQEYAQIGDSFSEDIEEITGHYIQLNVFSKIDYSSLVEQVKELLGNVGFKRKNEFDLFESDTGYFNHVIRFFYAENQEKI
ncbi:MAG: hypothetical protein N4A63_08100 [Vallitalea sp.]|jgi:hypothetical protein|nr:hypothetical protein [Vallitalea sp.]